MRLIHGSGLRRRSHAAVRGIISFMKWGKEERQILLAALDAHKGQVKKVMKKTEQLGFTEETATLKRRCITIDQMRADIQEEK